MNLLFIIKISYLLTEIERQKNIERNRELLAQFNLTEARSALKETTLFSKKDSEE